MTLAAPAAPHWIPIFLPCVYDYRPVLGSTGRPTEQPPRSGGLIGSLPLLIGLAAFSAHPTDLVSTLTQCIRPNRWISHLYQSGRMFTQPL